MLILSVLLLITSVVGEPLGARQIFAQNRQAAEKAKVNQLIKAADDLAESEHCRPDHNKPCEKAFETAAEAYEKYIKSYLEKNRKSQEYALANYQVGELWEKRGANREARRFYEISLECAKDNDFDHNGHLLTYWATARLEIVEDRIREDDKQDEPIIRSKGGSNDW